MTATARLPLFATTVCAAALLPAAASAVDWNVTGSVRQEIGVGIASGENEFNQNGNPFNDRSVPVLTNNPLNGALLRSDGLRADANTAPLAANCKFQTVAGCPAPFNANAVGAGLDDSYNFNLFSTRLDLDVQARINTNWAATMKLRAVYDAVPKLSDGRTGDIFGKPYWHHRSANPLEINGASMMADLPAFYVDYNDGPLWIRAGQQQIAWGEALFFRVMDVANGLDLRRHLTLTPAAEEFQDQRIASPALRVSYTFDNQWEVDAFVQMFTPTVLARTNTPYNVVPSAFSWREGDEFEDAEGALNFGARITAPLTDSFTLLAAYVNRRNPDGVVRWEDAPRYTNLPSAFGRENPFCAGASNNPFAALPGAPTQGSVGGGCGAFFAPDATATSSAFEWFHMAGRTRLNPVTGTAVSINEAPASAFAARTILGLGNEVSALDAISTLDAFYTGFGGLRGYITREFKREHVISLGGNYIFTAEPDSFLDQLIVRGEVAVTPDKQFTNLGLSRDFIEATDVVSALIVEKYQRFSIDLPAAYLVAQWMHRTESDLFGRHLSGNENRGFWPYLDPDTGALNAAAQVAGSGQPTGQGSANYVAFAIQQPFPDLVWRADLAVLVDVQGGVLVQPGVRYRPSANWQWDLYANVIEGGGDENDDALETLDFADEIFMRVTYFF
ncbi:MAG: DUF1302 family protein [Gammaproteobacteria bacterium]